VIILALLTVAVQAGALRTRNLLNGKAAAELDALKPRICPNSITGDRLERETTYIVIGRKRRGEAIGSPNPLEPMKSIRARR
jgi:hypothetical protein